MIEDLSACKSTWSLIRLYTVSSRGMGGGEGDEGEGEKVAAAVRGESGRRLREKGVLPY
jgi:hypothetical protein